MQHPAKSLLHSARLAGVPTTERWHVADTATLALNAALEPLLSSMSGRMLVILRWLRATH